MWTYDRKYFKNFFVKKKLFQRINEFKAILNSPKKPEIGETQFTQSKI